MFISVVIPLYNKEKSIVKTVQSVLDQTFRDFELIIVDDGSTDTSFELISSFGDERINIIRKQNGGVSSARNIGVNNSRGNWIVFLDADDLFLPNALDVLYSLVVRFNVDFVAANFYRNIGDTQFIALPRSQDGLLLNAFKCWSLRKCLPRTGCTMISRELCLKYPFNESLDRFEDSMVIFDLFRNTKIAVSSTPILIFQQEFNELSMNLDQPLKDFVFYLEFKGKSFWEKVSLGGILYSGLISYPRFRYDLVLKYGINCVYAIVSVICLKVSYFRFK